MSGSVSNGVRHTADVTFDNPPLHIFGPESVPQLNEIVMALEIDQHLKVVIFDSAVDGFFFDAL